MVRTSTGSKGIQLHMSDMNRRGGSEKNEPVPLWGNTYGSYMVQPSPAQPSEQQLDSEAYTRYFAWFRLVSPVSPVAVPILVEDTDMRECCGKMHRRALRAKIEQV